MTTAGFSFSELGGFRLLRFECLNWGTFSDRVWSVELDGKNGLLSGVNGSGKSTLADGLTTLLYASNRAIYNKAGGAEDARDRTLYTYVRGKHKNVQDESGKKEVFLRGKNKYTVLLAHFRNEALGEDVTLAAVFYLVDETQRSPRRFYTLASRPLGIVADFSGFGGDIAHLKKRLKAQPGVECFDSFRDYSEKSRQRLGLSAQGVDLFYQTVSLKSINSLTEFVREHMLSAPPVGEQVEQLCESFDNLDRAHTTVVEARRKVDMLLPIETLGERLRDEGARKTELEGARTALAGFFAGLKAEKLARLIEEKEQEKSKAERQASALAGDVERLRRAERGLDQAIEDSGGSRLKDLEKEVAAWELLRDARRGEKGRLDEAVAALGLRPVRSSEDFRRVGKEAEAAQAETKAAREASEAEAVGLAVRYSAATATVDQIDAEVSSLRQRQNNLPARSLEIRRGIGSALGIDESEIPFAGELLQVRAEASEWEGASERLLHNFALSLLVPDAHYAAVSAYVERTALRGKLVYYRVRPGQNKGRPARPEPTSLIHKLEIRSDSPFYGWLEEQLAERFDYPCCSDIAEMQRLPRGITRAGQLKHNVQRHEKDDRHAIDDRGNYVLGWSTKEKLRTLQQRLGAALSEQAALKTEIASCANRRKDLDRRAERLSALLGRFDDFSKVDFAGAVREIDKRTEERQKLLAKGGKLAELAAEREQVLGELARSDAELIATRKRGAKAEQELETRQQELAEAQEIAEAPASAASASCLGCIETVWAASGADRNPTLNNLGAVSVKVREALQAEIDKVVKRDKALTGQLTGKMTEFVGAFPAAATDLGRDVESLPEYLIILRRLQAEDLPAHEQRFQKLLTTETIRGVALFLNFLEKEKDEIARAIATINASLQQIDYDAAKATYIELISSAVIDEQVSDFRAMLRNCLEEAEAGREIYTEERFVRVKAVIDLLRGATETERRLRDKVIDVRNWCDYSASERYRESGEEREFYPDSSGKSGGQKEKLAYTVLASALAYQYRLEAARSFRFVLIDEAFSRASDDNSRYALELFRRLDLQLLVITPLQKTYVIEPYIRTVHYAVNPSGEESAISRLTVEELHRQREFRAATARVAASASAKTEVALAASVEESPREETLEGSGVALTLEAAPQAASSGEAGALEEATLEEAEVVFEGSEADQSAAGVQGEGGDDVHQR